MRCENKLLLRTISLIVQSEYASCLSDISDFILQQTHLIPGLSVCG